MFGVIKMTKSEEAISFIASHCKHMGSYEGDFGPYVFLKNLVNDMASSQDTILFPARYGEHVAYAISMVIGSRFTEPPAAVAATYLVTRFEYYFRILSGKLKGDGSWIDRTVDQPIAISALGDDKSLRGNRVSNVAVAYKLMILNNDLAVSKAFERLDRLIFPEPRRDCHGSIVANVGDRIAFGRHSVGHGLWGDMSAEAVFYGLATGIVFYTQYEN
jgi:hypothetical protein